MMTSAAAVPEQTAIYNPAQQSVIDLLGRGGVRAVLDVDLHRDLRDELEEELAPLTDAIEPGQRVWVSKHALTTIHGCEAHHVAGRGEFEWSAANARGIVAHRAIEVMVNYRGDPHPPDLVDEAMGRYEADEDSSLGRYLTSLAEFDRADLRGQAVNLVARFQDCFPPLKSAWRPRSESKVHVDVLDGRIRLSGKVDLTLGRPGEKLIIDLKTGFPVPAHREDLRFYALLETLTVGAAPRKVASYYLDAAQPQPEDITEAVLRTALRRTIEGVRRIVAVEVAGAEPAVRPGPQCRWCPLQTTCEPGAAALARAADPDTIESPW
jgi:CRISPR/Cas system-associated exonuclease Cas4 (RecB family)